MKILVIGGAGYIGSHVLLEIMSAENEIVVFDSLEYGDKKNIPTAYQLIQGDILDQSALDKAMSGVDAVIHLAALKAAGESGEKINEYAEVNISGTINILNSMVKHGVKYMIFSSSAAVYGHPEVGQVTEDSPTVPINFYGFTKLQIEHLLNWYSSEKNIQFAALRYFNVAGYDLDGRVTGLEKNPNNLFPIIMENLKGIRTEIKVFGDDYDTHDGSCVRDYIHVKDLAVAHKLALDYIIEKGVNLTVNLGTSNGLSVKEVLEETERIFPGKLNVKIVGRRAGDPDKLICNYNLAKECLGWEPKNSTADKIIKSMMKVYGL